MALALFDRVQETTTTTGTGSVTLAGAVPGFQSFAVVGNGNTCYYTIVDGSAWEVGTGTYSTSGPTLARTTVLSNSSGNTSPITLAAGTKSIFLTYPAEKSVNLDASDNVSPLGTVSSGVWQGSTVGVAYGGTGVTASSGANSVVLRDSNQNIAVNRVNQSNTNTTAAGGTTALTTASSYIHSLVGTGGQTYTLPDATTLTTGVAFVFNNLATGTLTIANFAGTTIGTVPSGGAGAVFLTLNSTTGGTWDLHAYLPEGVTFGTNAFNLGTSIITGGTWQGGTIQTGYGGTGLTSYTSGGAVYANSSSTLTSGTLPVTAGGTGNTTGNSATTSQTNFSNLTIGGSQVLYAGNYNSYAPTLTGGGASGTWGINISGNAATATTAANYVPLAGGTMSGNLTVTRILGVNSLVLNTYTTVNPSSNVYLYSPLGDRDAWIYLDSADTGSNWGIYHRQIDSAVSGLPGNSIGFIGGGTSALQAWISLANGSANFAGALTQAGNQVLHAGNYNSYAPTLTGTGATGTWAINITGSAGSAGSVDYANLTNKGGGTGTYTTSGDYRAPAYYDSNDTAYYGDFNNTSVFSKLWLNGKQNGVNQGIPPTSGTSTSAIERIHAGYGTFGEVLDIGMNVGPTYAWIQATNYTNLATTYPLYLNPNGGFVSAGSDFRAPIFYDSNDTAFYTDPNATSAIRSMTVGYNAAAYAYEAAAVGKLYFGSSGGDATDYYNITTTMQNYGGNYSKLDFRWYTGQRFYAHSAYGGFRFHEITNNLQIFSINEGGNFALANQSMRAPIFYDSDNTGYYIDPNGTSRLNTMLVGNGDYADIRMTDDNSPNGQKYIHANNNNIGFLSGGGSWIFRVDNDSICLTDGSFRAPIFYDSNNTAYYCDPNSTSRLEVVRATVLEFGGSSAYAIRSDAWAGTSGYPGYSFAGGNSRFGFSSTGGYIDVYTDGNYYGGIDLYGANRLVPLFDANQGGGALYSSILYDTNNTGYYCDPSGTSNFNATVATVGTFTNNGSSRVLYLKGSGNIIQFQDADGTDRWEIVGRNGEFYVYKAYGTGAGYKWQIDNSGNHIFNGIVSLNTDIRSPIFYDINNTAYYLDPNSTGTALNIAGNIFCIARGASWSEGIRVDVPSAGTWGGIRFTRGNVSGPGNWAIGFTGLNSTDDLTFYGGTSNLIQLNLDQSGNLIARGNVTAYGSPSDRRLKENIQPLTGALDKIMQLQGCTFSWKEDSREYTMAELRDDMGFIADDVQEILPAMVRRGGDGYLSLRDRGFSALLVEAMKEQQAQIAALRAEVNALRAH
jgi:hypothetical protein